MAGPRTSPSRPFAADSRLFLLAVSITALLMTACRETPPAPPEPARGLKAAAEGWNVVLLSVDTLRADRLGAYGYEGRPTSPHLDHLVAGGVRFANAHAPRALTWPSMASALTGLYPSGHGLIENGYSLPDDLATLPLVLEAAGYRTGAFLSNMCRANHRGWDDFSCSGGQDGKAVNQALEWLAQPAGEEPFFLWVHLFGPHSPYYNGGDLAATQLDPGYQGILGPKKWRLDQVMKQRLALIPRDLIHLDALYDAAVIGTDRFAGRLLDEVKQRPNTLIVFLADHGEELYEHNGYLYHACSVYQTTLHVPLAFVADGLLPSGASVPQDVELIDILPTMLDLLGLPAPPDLHGSSLVPYLQRPGEGGSGKPAYSEYGDTRIHTVVHDGWKLVDNPDNVQPVCMAGVPLDHYPLEPVELYDLRRDPGETVNVADQHPARVVALRELIAHRFAGLRNRSTPQDIPDDLREELEALGYLAN
ncbi:MAG: sulfatase [Acidobacteriota bacterium]